MDGSGANTYSAILSVTFLLLCGCNEPLNDPAGSNKGVPAKTATAGIGAVAFLMKDNLPYIMVNMTPERANFRGLDAQGKEAYFLRRATELVLDYALARSEYDRQPVFVVRMVQLDEKDDYNRPKWGNATNLAVLGLSRANLDGVTKDRLANFSRAQLQSLFTSVQFQ